MSDQTLTNLPMPVAPAPTAPAPAKQAPPAELPVQQAAEQVVTADVVASGERCLNCDAALTGEYCAKCGQNSKHHVHSTVAMIAELIEDLFHTDHRVWRTLWPLLTKPGLLTVEYLRGKRVSYTPPFRLYIVLSLIYFFTASLSPEDTNIVVTKPDKGGEATVTYDIDASVEEKLDAFLARIGEKDRAAARERVERSLRRMPPKEQKAVITNLTDPCSQEMLGRVLSETFKGDSGKVLDVCRRVTKNEGKDFMEELKHHIPQMMFFFLPLIALWAKVLYIGSRRFYAEHFLFFVHFHACFFLIMAVNNVLGWGLGKVPYAWAGITAGLLTTFVVFYIPLYLYFAMRRVYRQGRFVTSLKYVMLFSGYVANGFIAFAVFAAYTAMMLN